MNHFEQLHPVVQAFLATLFTWALTALGAASVFLTKTISRRLLDFMLAFAGGVMIAASFWSLLAPGIEMAQLQGQTAWIPAAVGFLLGGAFLRLMDRFLPHLHLGYPMSEAEGVHTRWRRTTLLVMAITLHNIPEGLAVGVAFGALRYGLSSASFTAACALAMGIGLQNLPEGMAVSVPIRQMGTSRLKSFWYGQLSGMVEPIAGLIGAAAVVLVSPILPYAMGFAAGAMIYVVVEEVIPESQRAGNTDLATVGTMV
ncbi:MAG TPA: ZIP family metal transporter, partial [Anaerohalosphaeraceae bacterium]|nr:ZIP family metal transporter [Anaerohalosphaeraceae bacterium]